MGALRWILLLAGLLFLAALAAWEQRRPRQARRDGPGRSERSEPEMGTMGEAPGSAGMAGTISGASSSLASRIGPLDQEPSAGAGRIFTGANFGGGGGGRVRAEPPPRIDLPPLEPIEVRAPAGDLERRMARSTIVVDEPISADGPGPAPGLEAPEPYYVYARAEPADREPAAGQPADGGVANSAAGGGAAPDASSMRERALPADSSISVELPSMAAPEPTPVVDWPPEAERRIISVRIAALSHERLSGRVVRLALGACGFEHGRFGIFHQPGADGRALLSAANLSKPGIFDLPNMDFQRFSGLSLFAVLPGPLPPGAALDHLLDTAQDLAERLRARLQDEQGLPLGAEQLETLRRTVQDLAATERAEPAA
jgi:cell division protein ZipA